MLGSERLLWTRDGKGGPDDPSTSMSILLKWLTAEGNYNKYRGGPTSHGKGKMYWASILSSDMKEAGIRKYRSPKAIKNKIQNLEDAFKHAHDWAGQTGAGVKEDDPRQFKEYILKKCPHYFDLLDVMQDRSTCRPQLTSDALRPENNTARNKGEGSILEFELRTDDMKFGDDNDDDFEDNDSTSTDVSKDRNAANNFNNCHTC